MKRFLSKYAHVYGFTALFLGILTLMISLLVNAPAAKNIVLLSGLALVIVGVILQVIILKRSEKY
jgi:hypothetical protein